MCNASCCMSTGIGAGQGPPHDCIGSEQGRGSGCITIFWPVTRCGHTCRRHGCSRGAEHAPAYLPQLGICVSASPCASTWDVPFGGGLCIQLFLRAARVSNPGHACAYWASQAGFGRLGLWRLVGLQCYEHCCWQSKLHILRETEMVQSRPPALVTVNERVFTITPLGVERVSRMCGANSVVQSISEDPVSSTIRSRRLDVQRKPGFLTAHLQFI